MIFADISRDVLSCDLGLEFGKQKILKKSKKKLRPVNNIKVDGEDHS